MRESTKSIADGRQSPLTADANHGSPQGGLVPWALLSVLAFWGAISIAASVGYQPPSPLTAEASPEKFSAGRAEAVFAELVARGIPRPPGSAEHARVRQYIVRELEALGYHVRIQKTENEIKRRRLFDDPRKLPLANVIAHRPGPSDAGAVMMVAHYDSVPYGPGAADDGVSVAALLEIARMAQEVLPRNRELIFLLTDGEEYGLLGAEKFVQDEPTVERVDFVINLEARGTAGPSLMFQTSEDSWQRIRRFASTVERPVTSSIFEEIYKRLPNDTDFTIFRDQAGLRGYNFAFIREVRNYHTAADSYENVDRGSLQHQGQNAWNLLRALNAEPPTVTTPQSAVYFDLFGICLVYWPAHYSWYGSLVLALLFVFEVYRLGCSPRRLTIAVGYLLWCFVILAGLGLLLSWGCHVQDRFSPPWINAPQTMAFAFWSSGITCIAFLTLGPNCSKIRDETWTVMWAGWIVIACITSLWFSGASYLFLIPPTVAVAGQMIARRCSMTGQVADAASSIVAATLWLPIGVLFYDAIGFGQNLVLVTRIIVLGLTLVPVAMATPPRSRECLAWLGFAISIAAWIAALTMNPSA